MRERDKLMPMDLDTHTFEAARKAMVDCQVRPSDVTRVELIDAMLWAPREAFLPKSRRAQAYVGEHVAVGGNRFELDPMVFAKLINSADPRSDDLALVVGGGHGYAAAVLSRMVAAVVSLESDEAMAKSAAENLQAHEVDTAIPIHGSLVEGCAEHSPYNLIVLNGGTAVDVPDKILGQLADGGRIVAIRMQGPVGRCMIGVKSGGVMSWRADFDANATVLPGFEDVRGFEF